MKASPELIDGRVYSLACSDRSFKESLEEICVEITLLWRFEEDDSFACEAFCMLLHDILELSSFTLELEFGLGGNDFFVITDDVLFIFLLVLCAIFRSKPRLGQITM